MCNSGYRSSYSVTRTQSFFFKYESSVYLPQRLQLAADEAARSGDLQTTIEFPSGARHT